MWLDNGLQYIIIRWRSHDLDEMGTVHKGFLPLARIVYIPLMLEMHYVPLEPFTHISTLDPSFAMKLLSALSVLAFILATAQVDAALIAEVPTTTCTTSIITSNSTFCCDGDCLDGTSIGKPGSCLIRTMNAQWLQSAQVINMDMLLTRRRLIPAMDVVMSAALTGRDASGRSFNGYTTAAIVRSAIYPPVLKMESVARLLGCAMRVMESMRHP
jgi:hypothetical protein